MKAHLITALALVAIPAGATAQQCSGRVVGTLGITGMQCRDCSFSSHQGGLSAARFGTEPRILRVDKDASTGDDLETDDVMVAIDGKLITTDAGVEVLTNLRPGQRVQLRVRREGRVRDLAVTAGEACIPAPPTPRAAPRAEVAPRPPVPTPDPAGVRAAPGVAPAPAAAPVPPLPLPPGSASLGFSFRCTDCGSTVYPTDSGYTSRWTFSQPPLVDAVDRDGIAWAAGLRAGDLIVAVDDIAITAPEGGEAFFRVRRGQNVTLTIRRDGAERRIRLEAQESNVIRNVRIAPSSIEDLFSVNRVFVDPIASLAPARTLRFIGALGDTTIEVRGAPVTVSEDPATGEIIIRSTDLEVRLKRQQDGR